MITQHDFDVSFKGDTIGTKTMIRDQSYKSITKTVPQSVEAELVP